MWLEDTRAWAEPSVGKVGRRADLGGSKEHMGTRDKVQRCDASGGRGSCPGAYARNSARKETVSKRQQQQHCHPQMRD